MPVPLEPHVLEYRSTTLHNAPLISAIVRCDEFACYAEDVTYPDIEEEVLALLELIRSIGQPSFSGWEWPYDGPGLRSRSGDPSVASSLRRTGTSGSLASASYIEHTARLLPNGRVRVVVREHQDDALSVDRVQAWDAWLVATSTARR